MVQSEEIPKVWDLLRCFNKACRGKGWKTSNDKSLVQVGDEYHSLIGTRTTHLSTFKRIADTQECSVLEGNSYRVVSVSYTAWIFQQPPSKQLLETLTKNSEVSKKTALYDLSRIYSGRPLCLRLNETDSLVFNEFEKFLKEEYAVKVEPLYEPRSSEEKTLKSRLLKASMG